MCDIFSLIVIHVCIFLFQSPSDIYNSGGADVGTKDYWLIWRAKYTCD